MGRWVRIKLMDKLFIPFVGVLVLSVALTILSTLYVLKTTDPQHSTLRLVSTILIAGLSTIVVGTFIYGWVLKWVLLNRIQLAIVAAQAIAGRDLTQRLDERGEDELAILASAFNAMTDNLSSITKALQRVSGEIDVRASDITNLMKTQTNLSVQQSEKVSYIADTMSKMASFTRSIAESAMNVVQIALQTRLDSENGAKATDDSRHLMDEISAVNRERVQQINDLRRRVIQIGEVMEFIEQIADQTKLIAFNASIEAAGAGEMGRRFEVVAREIRRLAENVAESAGQIKKRITDIHISSEDLASTSIQESERIRHGVEASLNTVTILHRIREGAGKTNELIEQISNSINSQNVSVSKLDAGLQEIDQQAITLRNGLQELSGIAEAMRELSSQLKDLTAGFQVNANHS